MQLIAGASAAFAQPLQLELQVVDSRWIEQLTQLFLAQQLAQALAVQRQRLGTPLGHRRVAFVHVLGDVVEHQRSGEWRCRRRLNRRHPNMAPLNPTQHFLQCWQVEDVL